MTRDDFIHIATPLIRQGITLVSGLLAAKGFTTVGNTLAEWALTGSLLAASAGWALAEKYQLIAGVLARAPADDLTALLAMVGQLRAQGGSPILVAHLAQTAAAVAVAETQPAAVPLSLSPAVQAPPADAVVPPPQVSPGVISPIAQAQADANVQIAQAVSAAIAAQVEDKTLQVSPTGAFGGQL